MGNVGQKGERKVYKGEELKTIGMPCGGIMAGQLYVRGDGTLANWWIANNAYNTGYGIDHLLNFDTPLGPWKVCYQTFEPPGYIDQGFRITIDDGRQKVTRELSKKDFDDIGFIGEYPVAFIDYASKSNDLPVKVTLMAYTPFIPLNAKESATPATILKYKVTNTSAKSVNVDLTGWLQNLVCIDLKDETYGTLRNKVVSNGDMQSVYMEMNPAGIMTANDPVEKPRYRIDESHPYFGNLALTVFDPNATVTADISKGIQSFAETGLGDRLNGGITSTMTLKQGESKEVVFVLSWYFPNRPLSYKGSSWNRPLPPNTPPIGNMYSNWYNCSLDVVNQLYDKYQRLEAETLTFHDTYYNQTSLPYWLTHRLMMSVSTLASETCQWWATGKFWAWEGVGSCEGTCTHVWGYAQTMAALFPELERNLREMTDYSISLRDDGAILSRNGEHGVLIDGHASVILRMYREHLMSKNNYFLSRNWDKIKKSIEYIIREDHPYNPDGLIVKTQPNTYDIAFNGANTYVGGLYLAALRACEQMALIMKDSVAANQYKTIYEAGSKNTMDRLWNETFGYFIQDVDEKEYPLYQYGKGCLSDQLFGQSWSDLLRLGNLYPEYTIDKTLRSVWKYNWTNDVGPQTNLHLPERYYAHAGEPGLLICTWPFSKHPGEAGVRYRDEVWTGIEYQVAANMIFRGMTDEGLAIVKAIHSRYDGKKHNPWNEVECGDHYARAMASYGVLTAIQDYWYDGPKGIMGFAPKLMPEKFSGFFTSAEGWGNITQTKSGSVQQNTVEVKYGRLTLCQLKLSALPGISPEEVKIFHNDKEIPVSVENNNKLTITFNKIELKKGDRLKVTLI
ncbi:MAG: hypothetical protein LBF62_08620 [Tannerellaceae bacterium]|nr:hypothetical protein [Tannerellaceae bacterium]